MSIADIENETVVKLVDAGVTAMMTRLQSKLYMVIMPRMVTFTIMTNLRTFHPKGFFVYTLAKNKSL